MAKSDYKPYSANGANAEETTPSIFASTLLVRRKTDLKYIRGKTFPFEVYPTLGYLKSLFYRGHVSRWTLWIKIEDDDIAPKTALDKNPGL